MLRPPVKWIALVSSCLLISICSQTLHAQGLAKPSRTDFLEVEPVFELITVRKSNGADQLIRYSRRTGVTSYLKKNRWRLIKENGRRVRNSLYQVSATADATGGWNLYRMDVLNGDSWAVSSLVWNLIEEDGVKEPTTEQRYK
ncbi:hypothetical protein A9Q99_11645 [Gammaproteobacteria bacterium 45_16_T64]|nr:hypothetical protein A9Q99_11645 [Gammaproteobacteria bacterium 45_16_T64]